MNVARFDYIRDDVHRRIRIVAREPLETIDLCEIVDRQVREGTWTYGVLYDMRATTGPGMSKVETRAVAEHVRAHVARRGVRGPVALLTGTSDLVAVGQKYAYFLGAKLRSQFKVFWDLAEAERWLDHWLARQASR
ncbi:MAG: hypothetical protein C5B57_12375 [Blastocatellia bacterium]|nr:MAG: hypothetical protein C5B57_12375 [Blastocatellia bacterium]